MTAPRGEGHKHGPTLTHDFDIRYFSVSSIEKADDATDKGCPRRYVYHYKLKIRDEQTAAQARGTAGHLENEIYLGGGAHPTMGDVIRGLHILPAPGPDLKLEHPIAPVDAEGTSLLEQSKLRAAGVPFIGFIDCVSPRTRTFGGGERGMVQDPEGTVEFLDWKFTKDLRYAKTGPDLIRSVQMAGYGLWGFAEYDAPKVRLSHGYFPIKGAPDKRTILVSRDPLLETWEHVDVLGGYLKQAVKHDDINQVRANTKACYSFGKPCPAFDQCSAVKNKQVGLADYFGTSAEDLTDLHTQIPAFIPKSNKQMTVPTSALSRFKNKTTQPAAEPANDAAVKAEMERLVNEERRAGLQKLVTQLVAQKMGFPAIGEGQLYEDLIAMGYPELGGDGELAEYTITTLEDFTECVIQVVAEGNKRAENTILPPESGGPLPVNTAKVEEVVEVKTPENDASDAISAVAAASAAGKAKREAKAGAKKTGKKATAVETEAQSQVNETEEKPVEDATVTRGDVVEKIDAVVVAVEHNQVGPINGIVGDEPLMVFVNCVPSIPSKSLWTIVHQLMAKLATQSGAPDVRLVDQNSEAGKKVSFGKWKSLLQLYLREFGIPGGAHTFNTAVGGELSAVVLEVLQDIVEKRGGLYVQGAL